MKNANQALEWMRRTSAHLMQSLGRATQLKVRHEKSIRGKIQFSKMRQII